MPPWLILVLVLAAMVLWVGIESGLALGSWRAFRTAIRQYGMYVLVLAALGGVAAMATYVFI